jgi:hypothetical protein
MPSQERPTPAINLAVVAASTEGKAGITFDAVVVKQGEKLQLELT